MILYKYELSSRSDSSMQNEAARRQTVIGVATSLNQLTKKANLKLTAIVKAPNDQAEMGEVYLKE